MSRLRMVYIGLLVVLVVLATATVFRPMLAIGEDNEVQGLQLLQAEDEWVVQFDITNRDGKEARYEIEVLGRDGLHREPVLIRDGGKFSYIYRIPPDRVGEGTVTFSIYKNGADEPLKKVTCYLESKGDGRTG